MVRPRARLGWLIDGEFRYDSQDGPMRRAASDLVDHLRELGRLERADDALAQCVIMLGEACDADATNAALWSQLRSAMADIQRTGVTDEPTAFDRLIAELSADSAPAVPDTTQPKQTKPRGTDRTRRTTAGSATDATSASGRRSRNGTAAERSARVSGNRAVVHETTREDTAAADVQRRTMRDTKQ